VIEVRGNIEQALLLFRRECVKDGIHKVLKRRERYPNLTDRKKAKEVAARVRRRKIESKRERQQEAMAEFRRGERKRPLRRREKQ
jgi:ribosomal protein S21